MPETAENATAPSSPGKIKKLARRAPINWGGPGWGGSAEPQAANDNAPATVPPIPSTRARSVTAPSRDLSTTDAETLLRMEFEPVQWVVPGIICEGLTVFAGRPKLGKSWLVLNLAMAVAGGTAALGRSGECEQGDALYLALEDNDRRLQDRLRVLTPMLIKRPDLSSLKMATKASKIGAGLVEEIEAWRSSVPRPRLVVIDTFQKVRQPKRGSQQLYEADYEAAGALQSYASEKRLAVVVVTHVRKSEAEDPLEMVSGSNGITGAADSILVLDRDTSGPKLYGRGRDLTEFDYAMAFDVGRWRVVGDVQEVKLSAERASIVAAVAEAGRAVTPAEIASAIGGKVNAINRLVLKMVRDGQLEKVGMGMYAPSNSGQTGKTGQSAESA